MDKSSDSAAIVLFNNEGQVLLVHQTFGKKIWALPGGEQRNTEPPWEIISKVCEDNIDVKIEKSNIILSGLYFLSHRNANMFVFLSHSWQGNPKCKINEINELKFYSIDKLPSPISNFTIQRILDANNFQNTVLDIQNEKDYKIVDNLLNEDELSKKWIIYGVENLRDHKLYNKKESRRDDGSLLLVEEYFNGQLHGECIYYNEDGSIYEKRYYQHGTIYGPYEKHHKDGRIEKRIIY